MKSTELQTLGAMYIRSYVRQERMRNYYSQARDELQGFKWLAASLLIDWYF